MDFAMHATKLAVADVGAAERFYTALGMKVAARNLGGEAEVRQEQTWLSATGDTGSHILILSRFLELPAPPRPAYPGEVWLCFQVPDVDAAVAAAMAAGGALLRAGEDRPEHAVRAAVISDNEGHHIELVGPMTGNAA
ncbi:MAG: VOC family protein [Novosphingobium sp.]|jgi:catechol 2,3-dioxygenase-like lactoylglutathione lyase family enzyme|nr:VOC family protein [Novosphingobium sp.]